jgi:hypothetical protein
MTVFITAACSTGVERRENREVELRMKATCAEAGRKARQQWVSQYHQERFSDTPEFGYSAKLNTCLYADEYTDIDTGTSIQHALMNTKVRRDRFVLDVYANKVLLESTEHDGRSITVDPDPINCRTEAEFNTRKAELFGLGTPLVKVPH